MQLLSKLFATRFDDLAAKDHVREVRRVVLKQLVVVSNNQQAHFVVPDFVDRLTGQANGVRVEPRIGFVEDRKLWLKHRQLKNFSSLHFAATKAIVDVTSSKLAVHFQLRHVLFDLFAELTHWDQVLAFLPIRVANIGRRVAKKISHADTRNRNGTLERHEQTRPRTLVGLHL